MSYVDFECVKKILEERRNFYRTLQMFGAEHVVAKVEDRILDLPVADVRKNIVCDWIKTGFEGRYECQNCGFEPNKIMVETLDSNGNVLARSCRYELTKYCPDCGADMRGENDA